MFMILSLKKLQDFAVKSIDEDCMAEWHCSKYAMPVQHCISQQTWWQAQWDDIWFWILTNCCHTRELHWTNDIAFLWVFTGKSTGTGISVESEWMMGNSQEQLLFLQKCCSKIAVCINVPYFVCFHKETPWWTSEFSCLKKQLIVCYFCIAYSIHAVNDTKTVTVFWIWILNHMQDLLRSVWEWEMTSRDKRGNWNTFLRMSASEVINLWLWDGRRNKVFLCKSLSDMLPLDHYDLDKHNIL